MGSKQSLRVVDSENPSAARRGRNLERHLVAYATAAAGAGLMSAVLPADAQIVYTPSNISMAVGEFGVAYTPLDLNNDGNPDFTFSNVSFYSASSGRTFILKSLRITPVQTGNQAVAVSVNGVFGAAAIPAGRRISSQDSFRAADLYMALREDADGVLRSAGSWPAVETAYLGLKFLINGEVHYGWVRVKFDSPGDYLFGSIYGYAYESTPNRQIIAGQTSGTAQIAPGTRSSADPGLSSLGMLAAGASGVNIRRGQK